MDGVPRKSMFQKVTNYVFLGFDFFFFLAKIIVTRFTLKMIAEW